MQAWTCFLLNSLIEYCEKFQCSTFKKVTSPASVLSPFFSDKHTCFSFTRFTFCKEVAMSFPLADFLLFFFWHAEDVEKPRWCRLGSWPCIQAFVTIERERERFSSHLYATSNAPRKISHSVQDSHGEMERLHGVASPGRINRGSWNGCSFSVPLFVCVSLSLTNAET